MICSVCRHARILARRSASSGLSAAVPRTFSASASASSRRFTQLARPLQRSSAAAAAATRSFSTSSLRSSSTESAASAPSSAASTPTPSTPPKPDFLNDAEAHIWDLLVAALDPTELSVRDISGGCGSMYGIDVSSTKFRGANMLKQQRMVNAALGDLVKSWHGVQIKTQIV